MPNDRLVVSCLALAIGLGGAIATARADDAKPDATVLDRVVRIAAQRPFKPAAVAEITGLTLALVEAESNRYFNIYRSAPGAGNSEMAIVEVRSPTSDRPGKDGMVLIQLTEKVCLQRGDIGDRFGPAGPPQPTVSPHGPVDPLEYDVHKLPWGEARLGFAPRTGCLRAVVLDAIK